MFYVLLLGEKQIDEVQLLMEVELAKEYPVGAEAGKVHVVPQISGNKPPYCPYGWKHFGSFLGILGNGRNGRVFRILDKRTLEL